MGVTHALPSLTNLNTDVPSQMVNFGYSGDHSGISCQRIAEVILAAPSSSITFASVPGTYRDLLVLTTARVDAAVASASLFVQFNTDASAIYDYDYHFAQNTTLSGGNGVNATGIFVGYVPGASATANMANAGRVWFTDYANATFHKTSFALSAHRAGTGAGSMAIITIIGFWRSTAAITDIVLFPDSGSLIAGSRASLWGFD